MFHRLARRLTPALLALAATALQAQGAAYPHKPVRLVVPFAAGGPIDVLARALGARLMVATGQQFIIDNKPGGGSIIAWDAVAKANPDGYTLLVAGIGSRTILPFVATLPFDPAKDLVPVTRLADAANVFVVHPNTGVKTLAELAALARAQPGRLNIAIPAPATVTHFASTLLQRDAGITLTEVPYKGGAPAAQALVAGEVDALCADVGAVITHIQTGRMVALATASPQRLPMLPQVPTAIEAGFPNLVAVNVYGLFAPVATPREVIARLNALAAEAMRTPELRAQIGKLGMLPETGSAESFEAYLREQTVKWSPLAKTSGVRLN